MVNRACRRRRPIAAQQARAGETCWDHDTANVLPQRGMSVLI